MNDKDSLDKLVDEINSLISLPDVGFKVRELLADPKTRPAQVAAVIRRDPAVTLALLRVANSALISRGHPVEDVERAITRLGALQVQELTLGISVSRVFVGLPGEKASVAAFWRHSVYCAAVCRVVAYLVGAPGKEQAFTAGLLHDIGELIIYSNRRDRVPKIFALLQKFANTGLTAQRAEQFILSYDHTMVGDRLAQKWGLPPALVACIRDHHEPPLDGDLLPIVTHVADILAIEADPESAAAMTTAKALPQVSPQALEALGLDPRDLPDVIESARAGVEGMLEMFNA